MTRYLLVFKHRIMPFPDLRVVEAPDRVDAALVLYQTLIKAGAALSTLELNCALSPAEQEEFFRRGALEHDGPYQLVSLAEYRVQVEGRLVTDLDEQTQPLHPLQRLLQGVRGDH